MTDRATLFALQDWAADQMIRAPDFVIGPADDPYLRRWFIVPRNSLGNVYLHEILRDDDDRAGHDHPWSSRTLIIEGGYREICYDPEQPWMVGSVRDCSEGGVVDRVADATHRLVLPEGGRAVTLFTTGPVVRDWGFWCAEGERWVPWQEFTAVGNSGLVGRGCAS